jgi:uncharacterized Zn finger protein
MRESFRAFCPSCMDHVMLTRDGELTECESCGHFWARNVPARIIDTGYTEDDMVSD